MPFIFRILSIKMDLPIDIMIIIFISICLQSHVTDETITVVKHYQDDDDGGGGGAYVGNDDDEEEDDDFIYPRSFYKSETMRCVTYESQKEITIEQNYTVKVNVKKQEDVETSEPGKDLCQCSSLLEIKCRGGIVDFPRFAEKIVARVTRTSQNKKKEDSDDDEDNDEDDEKGDDYDKETYGNVTIYRVYNVVRQSISVLGPNAFLSLRINTVIANHNPIGNAVSEFAFAGLKNFLEELQLGGCNLRLLPDKLLTGLLRLERLHLWGNKISKIPPGFFKEAEQLRELVLWGNYIEELEENTLVGLWNLRRLDLDRNKIRNLSSLAFRHLIELEVLQLGENRITTLHGKTFSFMSRLKVLSLDRNSIIHLYSEAFNNLPNLLILSLDHNQIGFVPPNVFTNLQNLTRLWLSNNAVRINWFNMFSGLKSLHELRLADNNLKELPDGLFRNLNRLRYLILDNNELKTFCKCLFPRKFRLKSLSILSNPIECSCETTWLRNHCHTFSPQTNSMQATTAQYPHHKNSLSTIRHPTPRHHVHQQLSSTFVWGTCQNRAEKGRPDVSNLCWFHGILCESESEKICQQD